MQDDEVNQPPVQGTGDDNENQPAQTPTEGMNGETTAGDGDVVPQDDDDEEQGV